MFQRFVAGTAIGSVVIAVAALAALAMPGLALARVWPLTTMWCFVPLAWGVWALLTPRAWLPQRLPFWGAILGLVAGLMGSLVLNLPSRILGGTVPLAGRWVAVAIITGLYYFLWMLVRAAYRLLAPTHPGGEISSGGSEIKRAA